MALTKLQREYIDHAVISADSGISDIEWCKRVGITPRAVQIWKKDNAEVAAALAAAQKAYDETNSLYGRKTYIWTLEEAEQSYKVAKKAGDSAEARKWWKELNRLAEPVEDSGPRVDYSEWDLESLREEAYGKRGMDPIEVARRELKGAL